MFLGAARQTSSSSHTTVPGLLAAPRFRHHPYSCAPHPRTPRTPLAAVIACSSVQRARRRRLRTRPSPVFSPRHEPTRPRSHAICEKTRTEWRWPYVIGSERASLHHTTSHISLDATQPPQCPFSAPYTIGPPVLLLLLLLLLQQLRCYSNFENDNLRFSSGLFSTPAVCVLRTT